MYTPVLKTKYKKEIVPALMKEFSYSTVMQVPRLTKIVLNQGVGQGIADKKLLEASVKIRRRAKALDLFQRTSQTSNKKNISAFMVRYLERILKYYPVCVQDRDFKGSAQTRRKREITLGITERAGVYR